MTDTELLLRCRELIAQKLSWPSPEEWRNYEFTELSEKILEATGIGLSTTTLKRLFGKVQYNNLPSSFTLNALAKYLGYESWMQLKMQETVPPASYTSTVKPHQASRVTYKSSFFAGVAFVGLLITSIIFFQGRSKPSFDASTILFASKPLSQGLPNSVVFNFDLKVLSLTG